MSQPGVGIPAPLTAREGEQKFRSTATPGSRGRYCIRCAGVYDTASLRRLPARRPSRAFVCLSENAPPSTPSAPSTPKREVLEAPPRKASRASGDTMRRRGRAAGSPTEDRLDSLGDRSLRRSFWMKLRKLSALAGIAVLALGACTSGGGSAAPGGSGGGGGATKGTVKFAIDLPLQGADKAASDPIINGIKLAVQQAGGAAGGYKIDIPQGSIYDDALNGAHDPQTGANNMTKIVADGDVVAVIGPLNSSVAKAEIPISNDAGLTQCSPANTNPDLTKGDPAKQLRTKPNNYVRVVTTDDVQGPAAAQYIHQILKKNAVYIIDDTETFGKGIADTFEADFKQRGGT